MGGLLYVSIVDRLDQIGHCNSCVAHPVGEAPLVVVPA